MAAAPMSRRLKETMMRWARMWLGGVGGDDALRGTGLRVAACWMWVGVWV